MRRSCLLFLVPTVLLGGCGADRSQPAEKSAPTLAGAPAAAPEATSVYAGASGFEFAAAFRADTAWVFLPEGVRPLPHVVSASGAKYSDGQVMLWTKGDDAILSRHGRPDEVVHLKNPQ